MKKWVCLLMTLALALFAMCGYAQGAATLNLSEVNKYESASDLCFVGDTLYILGGRGIYAYDGKALTVCVDLPQMEMHRYNPMRPEDEAQAAEWDSVIGRIFTDGTALYGLHPYTGKVFEIADGELRDHAQLAKELLYVSEEEFYREIRGAVYAGGRLALLLGTDSYDEYDKTEIVLADLASQSVEVSAVRNAQSIAAGQAGELLVYTAGEQGAAIWRYDMESDALTQQVAALDASVSPGGLSAFGRSAVYLDESRVYAADGTGDAVVKAYIPVQYAGMSMPAACSADGVYAYAYGSYVFLRDVSGEGEASQTVLTVMGNVHEQMAIDFSIANPDIAIVMRDAGDSSMQMTAAISKDSGVDLFVLCAPGSYAAMLKNGYLAPVNSAALAQKAKALHPAITQIIFSGEQLYGYPMRLLPVCFMINETKWNEFGLGDVPATYGELLGTIDLWLQDYASDYPDYTVSDLHQSGIEMFIESMVKGYIYEYEGAEGTFTFDAPALKDALAQVAEYGYLFDSENEQWGMAMISSDYLGFGHAYTDSDSNRMMYRPSLGGEGGQKMYAEATIMALSASSLHADEAVRFMEFCADNLSVQAQYEMTPSLNEPVENTLYPTRVAEVSAELEALRAQLDQAQTPQEQDAFTEMIANKEGMLARLEDIRYTITEESIAVYREMTAELEIPYESAYFGTEGSFASLREVIFRYAGDGFKASEIDAMIRELDRVAFMVNQENR